MAHRFQAVTGKAIRQGYGLAGDRLPCSASEVESPAPRSNLTAVPVWRGSGCSGGRRLGGRVPDRRGLQGAAVPSQRPVDVGEDREPTIEQSVDDDAFEETGTDPGRNKVVRGENLFRGY